MRRDAVILSTAVTHDFGEVSLKKGLRNGIMIWIFLLLYQFVENNTIQVSVMVKQAPPLKAAQMQLREVCPALFRTPI